MLLFISFFFMRDTRIKKVMIRDTRDTRHELFILLFILLVIYIKLQ